MKGRFIALLLLGTFAAWLVGSYLPPELLSWQIIPGEGPLPLSRVALIISALLFVGIQIGLVMSAFKLPQRTHRHENSLRNRIQETDGGEIVVERRWEVLWTAVPLVVSVGLFIVSYCVLI